MADKRGSFGGASVSGHIQPTRLAVLISVAILTGALSWSAALIYDHRTGTPPGVPWSVPLVLGFLAAVVFSVALALRSRLAGLRAGHPDARPVRSEERRVGIGPW